MNIYTDRQRQSLTRHLHWIGLDLPIPSACIFGFHDAIYNFFGLIYLFAF